MRKKIQKIIKPFDGATETIFTSEHSFTPCRTPTNYHVVLSKHLRRQLAPNQCRTVVSLNSQTFLRFSNDLRLGPPVEALSHTFTYVGKGCQHFDRRASSTYGDGFHPGRSSERICIPLRRVSENLSVWADQLVLVANNRHDVNR